MKLNKCTVCGRKRKLDGELLWQSDYTISIGKLKQKFTVCPQCRNKSLKKIILAVFKGIYAC